MKPSMSRRAVLLGAAGLGLAGCGAQTTSAIHRGSQAARRIVSGSFRSTATRGSVGWTIAYPPGHGPGDPLPVVVSLHGRGGSHATTFRQLHLDDVLADVVGSGVRPFVIASVDGGDHSYWHRRSDGTDAGAMVRNEFVPLLRDRGLATLRLGLFGWSMGGYGALLVAGEDRLPVRAVAVSSPALFTSAGTTAAGAFDDAADFAAHDAYGHPQWIDGVPLRIACGTSDPFYVATRSFASRLEVRPTTSFGPGEHDATYWRRVAPAQLRFLGKRL